MKPFVVASILILSLAAPAVPRDAAPEPERITVPLSDPSRPATLKVSTLNGGITVEGYAGKEVVIVVAAGGEESDHHAHRRSAEGMRRIPNLGLGLSVDEENNVVRVEGRRPGNEGSLLIQVPAHSSLHLGSVNGGEIRVSGVEGEIELAHVNGGIAAREVAGSVTAHTTNGDIKVVLRRVGPDKAMAFSTLNGDVDVTFPADLKANVRVRSDRGEIYSDFEILTHGHAVTRETRKEGKRHIELEQEMQGTIGGGGPEILFKTFNGDIYIRRGRG